MSFLTNLSKAIGWLLAVFYSFVPNLGIAIILLTCTVMLVLFPLTAKQARSMIAMQRVQPEIKKIQQKYKDDRQKQNEEVMRFYQENKINPLSGCFPLLMQMPIFIALFGLLRHISSRIPTTGQFSNLFHDICGTVANSHACHHPKGLYFLGMNLSIAPAKASTVTSGFLGTLPYFVMVGLVIATGWYQAHQTMQRQAKSGTTPMNSQAQIIGRVMPVAFGVISLNFAAGLLVYFVTSNLWRIGQQQLVLNKFYDQPSTVKKYDDKAEKPATTESASEAPAADRRQARAKPGGRNSGGGNSGGANSGGSSSGDGSSGRGSSDGANNAANARKAGNTGKSGNPTGASAGAPAASGSAATPPRARPNPNTAQRKKKRKR